MATLRMQVVEKVGVDASGGASRERAGPPHLARLDEPELALSSINIS